VSPFFVGISFGLVIGFLGGLFLTALAVAAGKEPPPPPDPPAKFRAKGAI
jgi:hypothetical protein